MLGAGELARAGLPALHDVVLRGAGWSVELDEVLRIPSGIVVLETRPHPNGFRRTRVAGLEPEHGQEGRGWQAREGDAAASGARPGYRGVFRRCASFGVRSCGLRRPCAVCDGGLGRSRSHPRPGLRAINAPCQLGSALPRCSVTPCCARGGEERRPPRGAYGPCAAPSERPLSSAGMPDYCYDRFGSARWRCHPRVRLPARLACADYALSVVPDNGV